MRSFEDFEERLAALFALELRRQGVPDVGVWLDRLHTYCSYVPANTNTTATNENGSLSSSSRHRSHAACALVVDMTNIAIGDRLAVAFCESLLKAEDPNARQRSSEIVEWQILWRRCGLTDRILNHLELLVTRCPKLTVLDVSANAFTESGITNLLHAAAEVPCDIIVTDNARGISGDSSHGKFSNQPRDLAAPSPGAFSASAVSSEWEDGKQQQPQPQQSFAPQLSSRRLQRSPSLTATSTSVSPSQHSYASGNAEALKRRRSQLFGGNSAKPTTPASPSVPANLEKAVPSDAYKAENQTSKENVPQTTTPIKAVTAVEEAVDASPAPVSPPVASVGSHSPFPANKAATTSPPGESGGERPSAASRGTPDSINNTVKTKKARRGSEGNATSASSREPFDDRNDHLDVTANLNPMLDSVLDLSALTSREGILRQVHMFGGAQTVWDVLDAYEQAAEQQQQQSQSQNKGNSSNGGFDAALRAKLPVALLGNPTCNAITVLNLSRNHLTTLCPLPATLLRLDVSSNELTELSGLYRCKMLTVLNARRNNIREVSGLEKSLGIAHLFLGHNQISFIGGLAHLVLLETLDVTFNQLRTQSSLRMLSLCSSLRHLLLRGNPIMESKKPGFTAVLRNLCPTLLVVDEQRVGSAKLVDRALMHRGWGRPPNSIDGANPTTTSSFSSPPLHFSGAPSAPSALSHLAMSALSGGGGIPIEDSTASSLPFTSSRRREGSHGNHNGSRHRPTPFSPFSPDVDAVDERSLSLLHLLTRGVTAPTGYGDSAKSQHAAQHLARLRKAEEAKETQQRLRKLSANGRPLRGAVVKQLAEESRKYLEDTIMRRITAQQQQQLPSDFLQSEMMMVMRPLMGRGNSSNNDVAASTRHSSTARAATSPPSRYPVADTAGGVNTRARSVTSKTQPAVDPVTAKVLKRYELRSKPLHRRSSRETKAKVATTHAARLRAASSRRSVSVATSRQESPARTTAAITIPLIATGATVNSDARHHSPGGLRAQPVPSQNISNEVDATVDAVYVEDTSGGVGSYAALHLNEKPNSGRSAKAPVVYHSFEEAEIECSPISRDPQARLLTSLNTTATMYERSDHREVASSSSAGVVPSRTSPAGSARVYNAPRAVVTPSATSIHGHVRTQPQTQTLYRGPHPRAHISGGGATSSLYRDHADVEETAIYPASRSHSRGSLAGLSRTSQRTPSPHLGATTAALATKLSSGARPREADKRAATSTATRKPSQHRSLSRGGSSNGRGSAAQHPDMIPARASPSPSSSPAPSRSRSPSLQPLHIDAAQYHRVQSWSAQLSEDASAMQEALQALVDLLEAQRQPNMPLPESSRELPPTYLQERRRCIEILQESGMLADTQVPMEVVVYYGFSKAELEGEADHSVDVVLRENKSEKAWLREVGERAEVLRLVHLLGDAKTCLRYVSLLVGDGREKLLQQYVDQLKESLSS